MSLVGPRPLPVDEIRRIDDLAQGLGGEDVRGLAQQPRQVGIERELVDRVPELVQRGLEPAHRRREIHQHADVAAAVEGWAAKRVAAPDMDRHEALVDMFRTLKSYGGEQLMGYGDYVSEIRAIAMPNLSAAAQLVRFDMKGFAVSAGSACASGTLKQSRVLEAFGVEPEVAARTIRVSMGWSTTAEEIRRFTDTWIDIAMGAAAKAG